MRKKFVLFLLFLFSSHQITTAQTDSYSYSKGFLAGIVSVSALIGLLIIIIIKKIIHTPPISFYCARFLGYYELLNDLIETRDEKGLQRLLTIIKENPINPLYESDWNNFALKAISIDDANAFNLLFTNEKFPSRDYYIRKGIYLSAACKAQATDIVDLFCKSHQSDKYNIWEKKRNNICNYIDTRIETNQNMDQIPYLISLVRGYHETWEHAINNMKNGNCNSLKYYISHIPDHLDELSNYTINRIFIAACKLEQTEIISLLCSKIPKFTFDIYIHKDDLSSIPTYLISQVKQGNEFIINTIFNWLDKTNDGYLTFIEDIIKKEKQNSDCIISKIMLQNLLLDTQLHKTTLLDYKRILLKRMLLAGCKNDNTKMLFLLNNQTFETHQDNCLNDQELNTIVDYFNKHLRVNRNIVFIILSLFSKTISMQLVLWQLALQKNFITLAGIIRKYYQLSLSTQSSRGETIFHFFVRKFDKQQSSTLRDLITEDEETTGNNSYAINITNSNGLTPLHMATNDSDLTKILVTHTGILLNIRDNQGDTPLLQASRWASLETINTLLSCEKINLHKKNRNKQTFFFLLFNRNSFSLDAMPYFTSMTAAKRQAFFNNELHSLLFMQQQVMPLNNTKHFIDFCIQNGADLNQRNNKGKRPVDIAEKQWLIFKKISHHNDFTHQEQLYYIFLRETPFFTDNSIKSLLNTVTIIPDEISNNILKYYHQLTIQRYIAFFAQNNPDYHQMEDPEKRNTKKMILHNLYQLNPYKQNQTDLAKITEI